MSEPTFTTSSTPHTSTIEQLQQQIAQMQQLIETLQLSQSPPTPSSHSSSISGIKVAPPDVFDGTTSKADAFLSQLALYFHGKRLHDDYDRVIFALSYMKGGTAGQWAKLKVLEYGRQGEVSTTWNQFLVDFKQTFGDPNPASTARHKLGQLKQGSHTADEYVASFREFKDDTGYNDAALIERFEQGLNSALVDKIYALPNMPTTLEDWISWAIKLDRQWRQREANKKAFGQSHSRPTISSSKPAKVFPAIVPSSAPSAPVKQPDVAPMEVDSGWKTVKPLICFKCRKPGHKANDCKSKFNINNMDFDTLKAFMKGEIQQEEQSDEKDF